MIHFQDISVRFKNRPLFQNFDLKVEKGEKVLIRGKSGAGKSTLFNLLLGFQKPDSGTVYFKGKELDKKTVWEARRSIGYVSQDLDLGEGNVSEFIKDILSYRANQSLLSDGMETRRYLKIFDLEDEILTKDLQDISGGEKQRIAIISALLLQRDIYVLDEVTSALDDELKKKVAQHFVKNEDWTVLITSHDPEWKTHSHIRTITL